MCRRKVQISTGIGCLHGLRSRQVLSSDGADIREHVLGVPCLFALQPHASLHLYLLACISLIYLHLIDMTMHVMEQALLAARIRLMPLPCRGEFGSAQAMPPTVWR